MILLLSSNDDNQVSSNIDAVAITVNHEQHSNDGQLSTSNVARPDDNDSSDQDMIRSGRGDSTSAHK
jgi:hypothetical protein